VESPAGVLVAWVDSEPSIAGQAIDQSLRRLLGGFRLPGQAQKIDRIIEKFAEVGSIGMSGLMLLCCWCFRSCIGASTAPLENFAEAWLRLPSVVSLQGQG
jgi:hypothetical protein